MIITINRFETKSKNQQKVVQLIADEIIPNLKKLTGFISTKLYQSFDGREVLQTTHWKSISNFEVGMGSVELKLESNDLMKLINSGSIKMNFKVHQEHKIVKV